MFHKIILLKYDASNKKSVAYLDDGKITYLENKPLKIIDDWCIHNGSTAFGRMKAFNVLTDSIQKPAVLISERSRIIFFPTLSKEDEECLWINDKKIIQTKAIDSIRTEITFNTGFKMTVDTNRRIIEKQMKRCKVFLSHID